MTNLAGRVRGEAKTRGEVEDLLHILHESGQLLEAASVGGQVIPEGALLLPLGHWSHVPFGHPSWRSKVRGNLVGHLRGGGVVPTFWLPPLGTYTDPATGCVWVDYGADAYAWKADP